MTNSAQMALHAVTLLVERQTLTVSELARTLGIAPATAHRVLANCCATGYATQAERGGPYTVGPAAYELTLVLTRGTHLRDAAEPVIQALAHRTGELVGISVLEGRRVRFVRTIAGEKESAVGPRTGEIRPAHCTASGKAILARHSEDQLREAYRGAPLLGLTPRSVTDWERLMRQLEQVRQAGWAYSIGESDERIAAIAAPLVDSAGEARSALSIAAPVWRMQTRTDLLTFADDLMAAAETIQERLRGMQPA